MAIILYHPSGIKEDKTIDAPDNEYFRSLFGEDFSVINGVKGHFKVLALQYQATGYDNVNRVFPQFVGPVILLTPPHDFYPKEHL